VASGIPSVLYTLGSIGVIGWGCDLLFQSTVQLAANKFSANPKVWLGGGHCRVAIGGTFDLCVRNILFGFLVTFYIELFGDREWAMCFGILMALDVVEFSGMIEHKKSCFLSF